MFECIGRQTCTIKHFTFTLPFKKGRPLKRVTIKQNLSCSEIEFLKTVWHPLLEVYVFFKRLAKIKEIYCLECVRQSCSIWQPVNDRELVNYSRPMYLLVFCSLNFRYRNVYLSRKINPQLSWSNKGEN